ncbi:DUF1858 domain-containing protein [Devosia rhodophyticola]|uniref:DUF1858 domain-containing protein n=1 Tax=Devosia rhodophyticola TaxID=3026423 RepID=A0ABY7YXV9_9HYPH|nr:DUF1858 domain-containing protein [Devosia rhodophyticola]WDR05997.1 DUF1858 domain-containing protein [Devosia rhodophyticola]
MREEPNADMSVDDVMRQWPNAIPVFIHHHMLCVGCPVGRLHSLYDAALAHGLDVPTLMASISAAIDDKTR